jgi:A/G-specific adenine glycosylase
MSPELPLARALVARVQRLLRAWYRAHGRDLPWRRTRDPYPVWVSEVMLQQTQVATATPYYHAFLERFPTLHALARAPVSDVLHAWAGLGYYRRARHFHEAARIVVRDHAGRVPDDPERFGALPGVGRYTTAAVLSIVFDRSLPVLDGNAARVLSRLFAAPWSVRDPKGAKRLWALAGALVPMRDAGDWNQAVMELGARVCTPRAPRCPECPLRATCRARQLGHVDRYPPVAARRATERVRLAVAVIERGDKTLMTRREGPLMAGMWEPPGIELADGSAAGTSLRGACATR